ncbi:hypothetical protein I553_4526 [Mycobacterium xenopi 4042]|uniref:Uncharacterized protein n=1 Tax=Mycobacterium xenopi 4042 TaxID=1299334 RepID=X8AFJ1_MYCXE|nr:hypothetical protein I553_4526 [Mycobacterium xenopi 4042]EUA50971.1 hypothetical protein I552_1912 [Mycobacterium xenopi 3993]
MVFENLVVHQPEDLDGGPHMVRTAVIVAVEYFNPFVHRRPRRQRADIGERLHNHVRRRVDNDFPGCSCGHCHQASNTLGLRRRIRNYQPISSGAATAPGHDGRARTTVAGTLSTS